VWVAFTGRKFRASEGRGEFRGNEGCLRPEPGGGALGKGEKRPNHWKFVCIFFCQGIRKDSQNFGLKDRILKPSHGPGDLGERG